MLPARNNEEPIDPRAPHPVRWPVMFQRWRWLTFLHWRYERSRHPAADTGWIGTRHVRWRGLDRANAVSARRSSSAVFPAAALAFCLPRDECSNLRPRTRWKARHLVLHTGSGSARSSPCGACELSSAVPLGAHACAREWAAGSNMTAIGTPLSGREAQISSSVSGLCSSLPISIIFLPHAIASTPRSANGSPSPISSMRHGLCNAPPLSASSRTSS